MTNSLLTGEKRRATAPPTWLLGHYHPGGRVCLPTLAHHPCGREKVTRERRVGWRKGVQNKQRDERGKVRHTIFRSKLEKSHEEIKDIQNYGIRLYC